MTWLYAVALVGHPLAWMEVQHLEPADRAQLRAVADWHAAHHVWRQLDSGLWSVFIDRDLEPDTSGSAAMLAGLAIACSLGLLEMDAVPRIGAGVHSLEGYISADGLLRGCAQLNRGGEALQVSSYRVIAAFAMGLAARAHQEWLAIGQTALKAD